MAHEFGRVPMPGGIRSWSQRCTCRSGNETKSCAVDMVTRLGGLQLENRLPMLFFSAPEIPKIIKFCKYTALSVCRCQLLLKVKFKSGNLPNFTLIGPHSSVVSSMSLSSNSSVGPTKLCSSVVLTSDNSSLVRVQSPHFHRERCVMDHPPVTQHSQTETTKKAASKKSISRRSRGSVTQNQRQSGRKNHGTREMICLTMTRRTRTDTSPSSAAKNIGRVSRDSAAKDGLIAGAGSSTDTCVKGGTVGKDKSKKGETVSSTDNSTSKVVETNHTTAACALAQVKVDSPQTNKKSVHKFGISNPSSVSGQRKATRVTGSGRQNIPIGERRRNGIGRSGNKTVGSFSETDGVCTKHRFHPSTPIPSSAAGYTNRRLPSSKQGSVTHTHRNNSSHIQPPSTLRIPQRNLATARTTKCWTQGKRRVQLEDIAAGLGRMHYRSVIVMSGAGISTPSGIPDFRTPGTGLYDNLQKYCLPEPSAVFDAAYFNHNPRPFFSLAKELYPGRFSPNLVHCFVRLLQDKGVLLRNYTQNIDGLERLAGVCGGKLVEAHGSFSTASCTHCHSKQDTEEVKRAIFSDQVPKCKHKYCNGVVKPDIVFFGEDLPQRFYSLQLADFSKCDLLLIMGTSLEVEPFASLVTLSRHTVPRVLLNRELVGPFRSSRQCRHTDVAVCGDIIDSVREVVYRAGWEAELKEIQQTISQLHAGTSPPCDSASSSTCTQLDLSLKRLTLQDPPQPPETDTDSSSDSSTSSVSSESSSESD